MNWETEDDGIGPTPSKGHAGYEHDEYDDYIPTIIDGEQMALENAALLEDMQVSTTRAGKEFREIQTLAESGGFPKHSVTVVYQTENVVSKVDMWKVYAAYIAANATVIVLMLAILFVAAFCGTIYFLVTPVTTLTNSNYGGAP